MLHVSRQLMRATVLTCRIPHQPGRQTQKIFEQARKASGREQEAGIPKRQPLWNFHSYLNDNGCAAEVGIPLFTLYFLSQQGTVGTHYPHRKPCALVHSLWPYFSSRLASDRLCHLQSQHINFLLFFDLWVSVWNGVVHSFSCANVKYTGICS